MREVSDHVVRAGAEFDPRYPGALVTEWQPQERRFQFPISIVWMYDEMVADVRNDHQGLTTW
jgi:hypothetical protein